MTGRQAEKVLQLCREIELLSTESGRRGRMIQTRVRQIKVIANRDRCNGKEDIRMRNAQSV